MNSIVETARRLIRGKAQTAEALAAEVIRVEEKLAEAITAATQAHERHAGKVLELLGADDEPALLHSRAAVDAADHKVADIGTALVMLRSKLAAATQAEAEAVTQRKQETAEAMAQQLIELTGQMQAQFDTAVATLLKAVDLTEALYGALPARPESRPMVTTGHALRTRVEIYIFGISNGTLCQKGMSAHQAREKPDLVAMAREVAAILLARKEAT